MNGAAVLAHLRDLAGEIRLARAREGEGKAPDWYRTMEKVVALAQGIPASQWEEIAAAAPDVPELRAFLCPSYGRYLRSMELAESQRLLGQAELVQQEFEGGGNFAREAYSRVADMFSRIDFTPCRRFVMIGSGPLPVTLIHVLQCTPVPEIIGLDVDDAAIDASRRLIARMGFARIRIEKVEGSRYDFSGADAVYIANLVTPKAAVLRQVVESTRPGVTVILRNPYAAGHLLAEDGTEDLDPRLEVVHVGKGNDRFLSRHVFLSRT